VDRSEVLSERCWVTSVGGLTGREQSTKKTHLVQDLRATLWVDKAVQERTQSLES